MKFKLTVLLYLVYYRLELYPKNRKELEYWQKNKIKDFVAKISEKSSFYAGLLKKYNSWANFPFLNKNIMMANFDSLNTVGLKKEEAMQLALNAEISRDFSPTIGNI